MGNSINVYDKDDNLIGRSLHGIRCSLYVEEICRKYDPEFSLNFLNKDINEQLKPIYEKITPEDDIILLVFINDNSDFDEDDIPNFEKAISLLKEGDGVHENIKNHLEAYLEVLKKHKMIKTKYSHTYTAITVISQ